MKKTLILIVIMTFGVSLRAQYNGTPEATRECEEPTDLIADIIGNSIKLNWTGTSTALTYQIYREGELIDEVDSETTSYIDNEVSFFEHYCYRVSAICAGDEESHLSNVACIDFYAPSLSFNVDTLWMTSDQVSLAISNYTQEAVITLEKITLVLDKNPWYFFDYDETIFQLGQNISIDIPQGETIRINVNANIFGKEMIYPVLRFINSYQEARLVTAYYSTLDANESVPDDIQVYPNPANDFVTISADKLETIVIFNVLGQKVDELQTDEKSINISTANYENGIYFARVNGERTLRFVVTH